MITHLSILKNFKWTAMSQSTRRFHEIHGNNITIHQNWTIASRTGTNGNGLVFIHKPIRPFQKVKIKLVEVSDELPGIISIGFTSHDPSTLQQDLPKITRGELRRKPGFWVVSLSKHLCLKEWILFFYVSVSGDVYYGVNGEEKGHFEKKVDTTSALWALVDIWSPPTTIQLDQFNFSPKLLMPLRDNIQNAPEEKNGVEGKRQTRYSFMSKPLSLNKKIVIKINDDNGNLYLGVTSCDPEFLKNKYLSENPDHLLDRPEYWVVINDPTWIFQKDDEISYLINEKGEMRIWKNDSLLLKVVHVDHSLKLWGFSGFGKKGDIDTTSSLPLSNVTIIDTSKSKASSLTGDGSYRRDRSDKEKSECVVCCDKRSEAALYPCGHMCMCFECAKKQWRSGGDGLCPMCRAKIRDVLRVYKS